MLVFGITLYGIVFELNLGMLNLLVKHGYFDQMISMGLENGWVALTKTTLVMMVLFFIYMKRVIENKKLDGENGVVFIVGVLISLSLVFY